MRARARGQELYLTYSKVPHRLLSMAEIYDQIRKAIKASGKSRYRISKETGISEPALCRFMQNERGMSVERLEALAKHLGLEIVVRPKKEKN
jgi:transcriptional regulator with XRE-family HTH domain